MRRIVCWLAGVALACGTAPAQAGPFFGRLLCNPCALPGGCGDPGCAEAACATGCAQETCERTVYVPQIDYQTRMVTRTRYRPVMREKTVKSFRCETEMKQREIQCTVWLPEQKTRTVTDRFRRPVMSTRTVTYHVSEPYQETVQSTRRVCHRVPVVQTRIVREDHGHWEQTAPSESCASEPCGSVGCGECSSSCGAGHCGRGGLLRRLVGRFGCGACGGCGSYQGIATCGADVGCGMVWVPQITEREVQCTTYRTEWTDEPCERQVTRYRQVERTREVTECHYEIDTRQREVTYMTRRPEIRTKTVSYPVVHRIPTERVVRCCVMVPYQVREEVRVPVCTMVSRTIKVPTGGCRGCASCCR